MKATFIIEKFNIISEIPNYWSIQDYITLLNEFDVPVSPTITALECIEYLQMAVSELEPNEAANVLLTYKLSDHLNENQIDQISNDMLLDKISEEYPEINLHCDLFSINQLLFKLYNGKFPNTRAVSIDIIAEIEGYSELLMKEDVLRNVVAMTSDRNLIKRLFSEKLADKSTFEEANDIVWQLNHVGNKYTLITSEYWINEQEIAMSSFETDFEPSDEEE
jgi:hypothetical protein